jgi:hypothetical protein
MVDFTSQTSQEAGRIGWTTTGVMSGGELTGSRRKMFDDFSLALNQGIIKIYHKETIQQLKGFKLEKGKAKSRTTHDDLGIACTGAYQIQLLLPSWDNLGEERTSETMKADREKWRLR